MAANELPKRVKSKPKTSVSLRIKVDTKKKVLLELTRINKKNYGRKVSPDDFLSFLLTLFEPRHVTTLQAASLSNGDRLDLAFKEYAKVHGTVTRDQFLGMLLNGASKNSLTLQNSAQT